MPGLYDGASSAAENVPEDPLLPPLPPLPPPVLPPSGTGTDIISRGDESPDFCRLGEGGALSSPRCAHCLLAATVDPPPPPLPSSASRRRFCLISHLYDWTFCSSLLFAAAGPGVAATALASASMSIVVAGSSVGHLSRIEQTLHPSVDAGEEADEDEAAPVADGLSTPICTNSFSMSHLGMPA